MSRFNLTTYQIKRNAKYCHIIHSLDEASKRNQEELNPTRIWMNEKSDITDIGNKSELGQEMGMNSGNEFEFKNGNEREAVEQGKSNNSL